MKIVSEKDIVVKDFISSGSLSKVYEADFDGKTYAYKLYTIPIGGMLSYLSEFTEEDFGIEYFLPRFLVESSSRMFFKGYLTEYDCVLKELDEIEGRKKKIALLKNGKIVLKRLHLRHKRIHGDIHGSNMLFDEDKLNAALIDFDTMVKIGENINFENMRPFSSIALNYLAYNSLNPKLDIYLFNLATLSLLSGILEEDVLERIAKNDFELLFYNKDVNRLSKELLLNNTRKPYSGEYIIDYID